MDEIINLCDDSSDIKHKRRSLTVTNNPLSNKLRKVNEIVSIDLTKSPDDRNQPSCCTYKKEVCLIDLSDNGPLIVDIPPSISSDSTKIKNLTSYLSSGPSKARNLPSTSEFISIIDASPKALSKMSLISESEDVALSTIGGPSTGCTPDSVTIEVSPTFEELNQLSSHKSEMPLPKILDLRAPQIGFSKNVCIELKKDHHKPENLEPLCTALQGVSRAKSVSAIRMSGTASATPVTKIEDINTTSGMVVDTFLQNVSIAVKPVRPVAPLSSVSTIRSSLDIANNHRLLGFVDFLLTRQGYSLPLPLLSSLSQSLMNMTMNSDVSPFSATGTSRREKKRLISVSSSDSSTDCEKICGSNLQLVSSIFDLAAFNFTDYVSGEANLIRTCTAVVEKLAQHANGDFDSATQPPNIDSLMLGLRRVLCAHQRGQGGGHSKADKAAAVKAQQLITKAIADGPASGSDPASGPQTEFEISYQPLLYASSLLDLVAQPPASVLTADATVPSAMKPLSQTQLMASFAAQKALLKDHFARVHARLRGMDLPRAAVGERVAARLSPAEDSWALAIVESFSPCTQVYALRDADDETSVHRVPSAHVHRLSDGVSATSTLSSAASDTVATGANFRRRNSATSPSTAKGRARPPFAKGTAVLAVYPETTTFYKGRVVAAPVAGHARSARNDSTVLTLANTTVLVEFEEEEETTATFPVPIRHVLLYEDVRRHVSGGLFAATPAVDYGPTLRLVQFVTAA